jgi:Transcriptional regulator
MESREQQILRIAGKLFGTIGFDRTSLRQIAEETGITKAALYYYFPDKETLYDRVVLDALTNLTDYVKGRVEEQSTPSARLQAFILGMAEFMDQDRDSWMAGSNTFWSDQDRERRQRAIAARDHFEQQLRQIIEDLIAEGTWRPVNARLATRMLLSAMNQIPRWHRKDGPLSAVDVAKEYLELFTESIHADPQQHA